VLREPKDSSSSKDQSSRKLKLFYGLKCFIFIVLVIVFLLYLAYLIYKVITDIPTNATGYALVDELDAPDVEICSNSGSLILRCDFKWLDQTVTRINNCSDYIIPEAVSLGVHRNACKTFKANKTIKYTDPNKSLNGLREIGFYFNIPNISAEEATNIGIASLSIQLASPDFNPLLNPKQVISDMDKAVLSNLVLLWDFIAGMANYAAVVKFRTIAYKTILPNDANAIIGLAPKHHVTYYLESDAHYFPFSSNTTRLPNGTTSYFSVAAGSFIQEQTIEQRTHTVFSALGAVGGFSGVYAFLFGKSIKPYGYIHSLFNEAPKFSANSEDNMGERVKKIEEYLETFMHIKREDKNNKV
ncbi:14868_t:CDS:2, partial [Gigaspora rosea]